MSFNADTLTRPPVDIKTQQEIEQFYYREAWLLDNIEYEKWLALLDDDLHYFMPLRRNRVKITRNIANMPPEFSNDQEFAHFDDDITNMRGRIRKLQSDYSWSENPASRTRHAISNVMILKNEEPNLYEVSSAFIVYRNRLERQVDIFAGERRDLIRRSDHAYGFKIVKRTILLDQSTILSNNLSIFF